MEEDLQRKTFEEVEALKDLFLRRMMDDKVKGAAIVRLTEANEALQRQLDEKALYSLVRELLFICDRIDAQEQVDDLTASVEEELLEVLARREFYKMPRPEIFDPAIHNAVGSEEETEEFPEKSVIRVVRNGYFFANKVFRPADVVVAVKKKEPEPLE